MCWGKVPWRKDCRTSGLAYNMYEPALVVLQPEDRIRKYFPCRSIVVPGKEREDNPYHKYFKVVCLCDFGAIDPVTSKTNERFREEKKRHPNDFPCLEPPKDSKRKDEVPLATSKSKPSKPGDGKQEIWKSWKLRTRRKSQPWTKENSGRSTRS